MEVCYDGAPRALFELDRSDVFALAGHMPEPL